MIMDNRTIEKARRRIRKLHNAYPLGVAMPRDVCLEIGHLMDVLETHDVRARSTIRTTT